MNYMHKHFLSSRTFGHKLLSVYHLSPVIKASSSEGSPGIAERYAHLKRLVWLLSIVRKERRRIVFLFPEIGKNKLGCC